MTSKTNQTINQIKRDINHLVLAVVLILICLFVIGVYYLNISIILKNFQEQQLKECEVDDVPQMIKDIKVKDTASPHIELITLPDGKRCVTDNISMILYCECDYFKYEWCDKK